jgi:transcriptional regulator with XRE-family HTH domain
MNLARAIRLLRGPYSREQFAEIVGSHRNTLMRIEEGLPKVQVSTIETIAHGLGVKTSAIIKVAEAASDEEARELAQRIMSRRRELGYVDPDPKYRGCWTRYKERGADGRWQN